MGAGCHALRPPFLWACRLIRWLQSGKKVNGRRLQILFAVGTFSRAYLARVDDAIDQAFARHAPRYEGDDEYHVRLFIARVRKAQQP